MIEELRAALAAEDEAPVDVVEEPEIIREHVDHVYDWIWQMGGSGEVVSPFCVELILVDGSRHSLHSVPYQDEATRSLVLRVWDFRAFSEKDLQELRLKLNDLESRADLQDPQFLDPRLDWANLRIHLQDIHYFVEWNDKLWPHEERPQFGFAAQ